MLYECFMMFYVLIFICLSVMYNTADIDNVPCFRSFAVCEVLYGSPQYDVHSRRKFHQKLECIVCRLPFGPRHLQKVPRAQTCLGIIREGLKTQGYRIVHFQCSQLFLKMKSWSQSLFAHSLSFFKWSFLPKETFSSMPSNIQEAATDTVPACNACHTTTPLHRHTATPLLALLSVTAEHGPVKQFRKSPSRSAAKIAMAYLANSLFVRNLSPQAGAARSAWKVFQECGFPWRHHILYT